MQVWAWQYNPLLVWMSKISTGLETIGAVWDSKEAVRKIQIWRGSDARAVAYGRYGILYLGISKSERDGSHRSLVFVVWTPWSLAWRRNSNIHSDRPSCTRTSGKFQYRIFTKSQTSVWRLGKATKGIHEIKCWCGVWSRSTWKIRGGNHSRSKWTIHCCGERKNRHLFWFFHSRGSGRQVWAEPCENCRM